MYMEIRSQSKDSPHSISTLQNENIKADIVLAQVANESTWASFFLPTFFLRHKCLPAFIPGAQMASCFLKFWLRRNLISNLLLARRVP